MTDHVVGRARPEPFSYYGYTIAGWSGDAESFAAAIERALADGLTMVPGRAPQTWLVINRSHGRVGEYVTSAKHGCSCASRVPCKHIALVLLVETITGAGEDSHSSTYAHSARSQCRSNAGLPPYLQKRCDQDEGQY